MRYKTKRELANFSFMIAFWGACALSILAYSKNQIEITYIGGVTTFLLLIGNLLKASAEKQIRSATDILSSITLKSKLSPEALAQHIHTEIEYFGQKFDFSIGSIYDASGKQIEGFRFRGGDPASPSSWEPLLSKIQA